MKKVKDFENGDIVSRTTKDGTSTYTLTEKNTDKDGVITSFIGVNGDSVALVGLSENSHLNVGCDWYSAKIEKSDYSYKLITELNKEEK